MLSKPSMIRLGFLVAVLGMASTASATEPTNYSGAQCVNVTSAANVGYTDKGTIENFSAPSQIPASVLCTATKKANTSVASGFVVVKDQRPGTLATDNVTCTMFSMFANATGGFDWFTSPTQGTTGSSTLWRTLSFGALASAPTDAYFYVCNIPGPPSPTTRSAVAAYQFNEN